MFGAVHPIHEFLVDVLSGLEFGILPTMLVLHSCTVTLKTMVCKWILPFFAITMKNFGLKAFAKMVYH